MPAPKLSRMPFVVTRTREGAAPLVQQAANERQARQIVMWCAVDNCNATATEGNAHANAVRVGEPYAVGPYVFVLEPAP